MLLWSAVIKNNPDRRRLLQTFCGCWRFFRLRCIRGPGHVWFVVPDCKVSHCGRFLWMHCDQSAYRGISLWTHQTSIRCQMGHRGIFPQAEIYRLSNFHSCRPGYIKQEIWAKLIAYNMTETLINQTILKKGNTKYEYKVNFSMAANIPDWKQLISENPNILYIVQHKTVPLTTIRPFWSRCKSACLS